MYDILIESDAQWNRCHRLPAGEHLIGRDGDVSIYLDDPSISRHHARLRIADDGLWVEDLGSANGSFINGLAISSSTRVEEGQVMVFGNIALTTRRADGEASDVSASPYAKGEMVAHGGMGAILGARQISMDREVAMKVMLREGDEAAIQRFIHEARVTGKLEHPNIVPVHELGTDEEGRVFYTMKFVRGITLANLLDELRAAPTSHNLASLLTVFQKVCDAVGFAHSRGVIHRDLKPENIMLGDFGEVLVMDWGLAKDLSEGETDANPAAVLPDGSAGSTLDGSVLGTPAYMSPEQARGEVATMDARSDIYALGVILHEILYLRPVVTGASAIELIEKTGAGQVDRIGRFRSKHLPEGIVPASLRAVRRKALAFDPEHRYPSVGELQADIAAYQSGFATAAERAGAMKRTALFLKRHRGVSRAVGVAGAALFCLSLWFVLNVVRERNIAERARIDAEQALALVEPARIEATAQRDRASAALIEAEAQRELAESQKILASAERDRAVKALSETQAIRKRATDALLEMQNAGEIFSRLTVEYVRAGQVEEALENIDRALVVAPQNRRYRVARANLLQASGRFAQAIPEYRRALVNAPDPEVEKNLALSEKLLREQGEDTELSESIRRQLEEALEAQNRALESILLEPHDDEENEMPSETTDPDEPIEDDEEEDVAEAPAEPDPREALAERLGSYTEQPGWNIDRITLLPDGSFRLNLDGLEISDLSSLRDANIHTLILINNGLEDLSVIRDLPLRELHLWGNKMVDLSPLEGMPLRHLNISNTPVRDLSPLRGLPLEVFASHHTRLEDIEPLVSTPLREMYLSNHPLSDYAPISKMVHLVSVKLPPTAHGMDLSKLKKLEWVDHPRFHPKGSGAMPARDFIALSELSDLAWKNLRPKLTEMDAENLTPDRLTVLTPGKIDLDLRRTKVTDLKPLAGLPIDRLYLDTHHIDLDVSPLTQIPALKHLVLRGARISKLHASFIGTQFESILLSKRTSSEDMALIARHPTLQHVSYNLNSISRLPNMTRDDFFHQRIEESPAEDAGDAKPILFCRFDDPPGDLSGWTVVNQEGRETPFAWMPDPPRFSGRGGGALAAFDSGRDGKISYFNAPEMLLGNRDALYGGCMEFHIRLERNGRNFNAPDVVLISGSKKLVHTFAEPPSYAWRSYLVAFDESGGWRKDDAEGKEASERDIRSVLKRLDGIRIRGEYIASSSYSTYLDEFAIWSPSDTPGRKRLLEEKLRKFDETIRWGETVRVVTSDASGFPLGRNVTTTQRELLLWVESFAGREGCLMVHPLTPELPARIQFLEETAIREGTMLEFCAHGSNVRPGVIVRVTRDGETLHESPVDEAWQDFSVALPPGAKLSECEIEIHPVGWSNEYCFLNAIRIVTPAD